MKLKLKDLKPNPFKKMINHGKLNKVQIEDISGNLDSLGFMGAVPVVKQSDGYHLVNCHHRVEAMKQRFGNNHEVEVTIHKYDNDQLLRGMVIENLAQRGSDFKEEMENIRAVEEYLTKNKDLVDAIRKPMTAKRDTLGRINYGSLAKPEWKDRVNASDIQRWLKLSNNKWSVDVIGSTMAIYKKLDPTLIDSVEYGGSKNKGNENKISVEHAKNLVRLETKQEQNKMMKLLKDKGLDYRASAKVITKYKEADDDIKKKVLEKKIDIEDIETEQLHKDYNKRTGFEAPKRNMNDWVLELDSKVTSAANMMDVSMLEHCDKKQLAMLYRFLKTDFDKKFNPFIEALIDRLKEEDEIGTNEVRRLK